MSPRGSLYYYNGKKYYMPRRQDPIVEPTTDLQSAILFHICVTKNANYKSLMDATKRDRITVLQSLKILTERHLIYHVKVNPDYKKSKLIFKATDRGIFNVIGNSYSSETPTIVDRIESTHTLPRILSQYKEGRFSISSSPLDPVMEFAFHVSRNDLFDGDGFSLVKDIHDLWKHEVRMWMMEIVTNKHFDIKDLFGLRMRYGQENFLIPPDVPGLKETLIKIRKNLEDSINQLPD